MRGNELVSVIVPVYNVEKYIGKCIESILSQDYKNFECILVDDGSKDESGKICDKYASKDNRIVVIHKKNGGVSKARNCGLDKAKGDFVCFVDGDDYIENDYISYLYKLIVTTGADISLSQNMFSTFNNKQAASEQIKTWTGMEACKNILYYHVPIGVYSKLFRADLLKENKVVFDEELFMGEGYNFNIDAFSKSKTVSAGQRKIYFYRRDNELSATTKYSEAKCKNSIYAISKIEEKIGGNILAIDQAIDYARWRTVSDAFDYLCLSGEKKRYINNYNYYKAFIKNNTDYVRNADISKKDRIRAKIMCFYPELIPLILKVRRKMKGLNF